jgi:hypothetical protein
VVFETDPSGQKKRDECLPASYVYKHPSKEEETDNNIPDHAGTVLEAQSWAALADSPAEYEPVSWAATNRFIYSSQQLTSVLLVKWQPRAALNILSSILGDKEGCS